ncbi:glycosyltransferase family 2 protein [Moraxella sp. CTOTU49803]|uniref:glycosyltransferase family 2 protein n=1 Tax=Moraxella sp. CTOTU49803 TaxID=2953840 RepID=UPI0028A737B3|nr:glycosyltransferase family 2 protein [Moraxella sp. CTOTU49803]
MHLQQKVSIVMPVYNVENYIVSSIKSVLNQTYKNFELIIVIDGSKDNSEAIAREFEKADSRVKVYTKPNGGISDARNYGLNIATGDFIYFLDSDDWIVPSLLEENLKIIIQDNLDFVVFGFYQDNVDEEEKLIKQVKHLPEDNIWLNGEAIHLSPYMLNILGYAWNKIYRKQYLNQNNISFINGISLFEDILFNAKVYQHSDRILFNQKAYVHYVQRPVITLTKQFHEKSFDWIKLRHSALIKFLQAWTFENKEGILANDLVSGLRYCVLNLFRFKNQFNFIQKIVYIDKMLNDKDLRQFYKFYSPLTVQDKIYFILIKFKAKYLIALLAQLRS